MRMQWMAWAVLGMALWACTVDAMAAELRKCRLNSGAHAYVSDAACPAGSREQWQRSIVADPGQDDDVKRRRKEVADWQASNRQSMARARNATRTTRSTGTRTADATDARCNAARKRRDRSRDREFMRMTYERMQRLDQDVADACR